MVNFVYLGLLSRNEMGLLLLEPGFSISATRGHNILGRPGGHSITQDI